MEGSRFDQLVRQAGRSRRAIIGTLLAAAAVAPLGQPAAAGEKSRRRRRRRRDRRKHRTEPGLRLLEQLADVVTQATGDCDALAAAAEQFHQEHEEELQALLDEAADWSPEEREERTKRDRASVVAAVQEIYAQVASCRFRGAAASPICVEGEPSNPPAPADATCSGCDCGCICPLSSGECAAQCASCAFTGESGVCCWCGTCIDHNCSTQCENCCNA